MLNAISQSLHSVDAFLQHQADALIGRVSTIFERTFHLHPQGALIAATFTTISVMGCFPTILILSCTGKYPVDFETFDKVLEISYSLFTYHYVHAAALKRAHVLQTNTLQR